MSLLALMKISVFSLTVKNFLLTYGRKASRKVNEIEQGFSTYGTRTNRLLVRQLSDAGKLDELKNTENLYENLLLGYYLLF